MHPAGIEPALPESESGVLSIRLRLHDNYKNCVVQIGKNTIYQQKSDLVNSFKNIFVMQLVYSNRKKFIFQAIL